MGIMSFTPLSTRFPKIVLDFREGIKYLKYMEGITMTYGELRAIPAGWVTSHVINDAFNNARFDLGKNFRNEPVSEYDLRTIREKAIHFGEPVPSALAEVAE